MAPPAPRSPNPASPPAPPPAPPPAAFTRYLLVFAATLIGVFGLVWAYTAAFPVAFMESGYASWTAKKDMLAGCQLGQIAFFGDSRLEAGVVPAALPVPASNFGLAAGTAIEVRVAVDRALRCPTLPRQAVIALAPEHFGPVSDFFWLLSVRYGFLSLGDLLAVERLAHELGDDESLATRTPDGLSGPVRDWLYATGFPSLSFASLVSGRVFARYDANLARIAAATRDRGWAAYEGGNPVHPEHPDRFILTKLQDMEIQTAIAALRAKDVPVALLIMPFAETHGETAATLAAYATYLAGLARITGATLLDPDFPVWPPIAFADGAHLIPPAARTFTERLGTCLRDGRLAAPCTFPVEILPGQDGRNTAENH